MVLIVWKSTASSAPKQARTDKSYYYSTMTLYMFSEELKLCVGRLVVSGHNSIYKHSFNSSLNTNLHVYTQFY